LTWVDDNDASFQTGGANTVTIGVGVTVKAHSISQSITGTATTIIGGTLQLDSNIGILNGVGSGNATLTIGSAITLNGSNITVNAAQPIVLSGAICDGSNGYSLTKSGAAALTLSGTNSYTGGTIVTTGILDVRTNNALGRGALVLAGGTLENNSGAAVTLTNGIYVQPGTNSTLQITSLSGEALTLSGNISGSGNLVANSTGSTVCNLQLAGNNSGFSGTLTVNNSSGMRFWFASATAGSSNATWVFNSTGTDNEKFTFGTGTLSLGSLSGNGNTRQDASGTTTLSIGALNLDSAFSGTLNQGNSANIIAVTKVGDGRLTLSGNNPYTGPTTVNAGTLAVTGTYSGTGAYTVNNNGTLAVNGPGTLSSSSATVTVNAGGTFTSSGVVTLGGAVTLAASGNGLDAAIDLQDGAAATLTLAGGLALNNGNNLSFDLGSASDLIAVTGGSYTKNAGAVTINLNNIAGFASGTYNLITGATGITTNGFVLGDAPAAYNYTFAASGGTLSVIVADLPPPLAPSGLIAMPADARASLMWSASTNAAGYNIKRSLTPSGAYTTIAANVANTTYADTGLANGTIYYYVVSATNAAGESANSAPTTARPVSAAPPLITLSSDTNGLLFSWPQDHTGWRLQSQTDSVANGLGTNWGDAPGSTETNQVSVPINPTDDSVFFRLVYP